MRNKTWIYNPHKQKRVISDYTKSRVQLVCDQFLNEYLRPRFVRPIRTKNKKEPQCIEICWKWRGNFIHFKATYKDVRHTVLQEVYDYPFARLEYMDEDLFHLAYFRHTGEWWNITHNQGKILQECLDLMRELPHFDV